MNLPTHRISALAVLLALLSVGQSASAAIIYSDDFDSGTSLNGTAPDVRPGSQTWSAGTASITSGYVSIAGSTTNFLAWTPTSGNIYTLSVDMISPATSTSSTFAGIGFFKSGTLASTAYSNQAPNTPWAFVRTGNGTASLIGDSEIRSTGGSTGSQVLNTNFTVTSTLNLKFVLNTNDTDSGTAGTQWSLGFFVNDVQAGTTVTFSDSTSASLLSSIGGVGFTTNTSGNAVRFDNLVFSDATAVPEPASAAALAGAVLLGFAAYRRRRSN